VHDSDGLVKLLADEDRHELVPGVIELFYRLGVWICSNADVGKLTRLGGGACEKEIEDGCHCRFIDEALKVGRDFNFCYYIRNGAFILLKINLDSL